MSDRRCAIPFHLFQPLSAGAADVHQEGRPHRTVLIEVSGFLLVTALIWRNELFDLPHRWFAAPASPVRITEALMESVALLVISVFVVVSTLRLFRRLAERVVNLTACSHCRRVNYQGEWMEFDEYIEERLDTRSQYGMCPHCVRMVRSMIAVPIAEEQT